MIQVLVVEDDENYSYEISEELEEKLKDICSFSYAKNLDEAKEGLEEVIEELEEKIAA